MNGKKNRDRLRDFGKLIHVAYLIYTISVSFAYLNTKNVNSASESYKEKPSFKLAELVSLKNYLGVCLAYYCVLFMYNGI